MTSVYDLGIVLIIAIIFIYILPWIILLTAIGAGLFITYLLVDHILEKEKIIR